MGLGGGVSVGSASSSGTYADNAGNILKKGSGALAGGGGYSPTCPQGQTVVNSRNGACPPGSSPASKGVGMCCSGGQPAAAANASLSLPSMPAQPAWQPSAVARPDLAPINPQANYDPEIANELAAQRAHTSDLKAGTGFAMDVLAGGQRDLQNAQMAEAEQAAASAGIPFDRSRFLMEQQKGQNSAMAQEKLGREQMVGQSLAQSAQVANQQAGERDTRLGISEDSQKAQNEELLQRYGTDVQKYGVDANAATAANSALMGFYSDLMRGVFSAAGGSGSYTSNYQFG